MSNKFRTGFFGFNKEDVLAFVLSSKEKLNSNEREISALKETIDALSHENVEYRDKLEVLSVKAADMESQLEDYISKEAAITRLSESIGKLYLVAQANAKTIIDSAKSSTDISKRIVSENIAAAEGAGSDLSEIEAELKAKTESFTNELAAIKTKLEEAKEKISVNSSDADDSELILDKLIENVDAEVNV